MKNLEEYLHASSERMDMEILYSDYGLNRFIGYWEYLGLIDLHGISWTKKLFRINEVNL